MYFGNKVLIAGNIITAVWLLNTEGGSDKRQMVVHAVH
jgi:hypothetical protein